MEMQQIKFYQTGTFTVGNRLLDERQRSVQANMARTNSLIPMRKREDGVVCSFHGSVDGAKVLCGPRAS